MERAVEVTTSAATLQSLAAQVASTIVSPDQGDTLKRFYALIANS